MKGEIAQRLYEGLAERLGPGADEILIDIVGFDPAYEVLSAKIQQIQPLIKSLAVNIRNGSHPMYHMPSEPYVQNQDGTIILKSEIEKTFKLVQKMTGGKRVALYVANYHGIPYGRLRAWCDQNGIERDHLATDDVES